ncbi:unnamed protein product [Prunus armeniaca]
MKEGSPSSDCKQVRFSKRFQTEEACELEANSDAVPNADLMEDLEKMWWFLMVIKDPVSNSLSEQWIASQKWSLKGGWKLVNLGPWIVAEQYLVLQKWMPGFYPVTAHITRMAAWIRVSAIQLECFDVWALKRIGNLLGKLLKIDALTTAQNKGKFARLCVELDLTKPLEAFIQINQVWYNIEYEGLPDICYLCGHYGHKREHCTLKEKFASNRPGAESSAAGLEVGANFVMG